MNEISALTKEAPESSLTPSTRREHSYERGLCKPGRGLSRGTESVRNNVCCFSHEVYGILLQQPKWAKTPSPLPRACTGVKKSLGLESGCQA